ncbi:MAG: hypothetical protein HRU26_14805 [Psychroserpens sp.]|nr:hypothetical protein [Psychroserpens sp.]
MKWYKLNIFNKSVYLIALVLIAFWLFGSEGPWDLYLYLLCGAFLFVVWLIDLVVQALKDDKKKRS